MPQDKATDVAAVIRHQLFEEKGLQLVGIGLPECDEILELNPALLAKYWKEKTGLLAFSSW
jgi:hypothetical protein